MTIISDDGPEFVADAQGDTVEVITDEEAKRAYQEAVDAAGAESDLPPTFAVEVLAGRWRIDHTDAAPRRGQVVRSNQPGKLNAYGRSMSAYVDAMPATGNAKIKVRRVGFDWIPEPVASVFSATEGDETVPASSDDYANAKFRQDLVTGGDLDFELESPGRAEQVSVRAEGASGFDVTFSFGETSITFNASGGVVDEVLPVYYIDEPIGVNVADTSGNANNTVGIDVTVV